MLQERQNSVSVDEKLANGSISFKEPSKAPKAQKGGEINAFTLMLTFISAIGGFLFGYNTGVVSGALIMLDSVLPMTSLKKQIFVSITMGAAMFFSLISGISNDLIGRKKTIMLASLVFVVGGITLAASQHVLTLLIGRLIIGVGIGISSMSIPMYIAECSPRAHRGLLVTLNTIFVTGAQFISCLVCALASSYKLNGWRVALGLGAVPAFMQLVLFLFLPESPRWLVSKGKEAEARRVLQKIEGDDEVVNEEMTCIRKPFMEDKDSNTSNAFSTLARVVGTGHVRRALIIGSMLQLIQQVAGVNAVMYYSATIIQMSGVEDLSNAIWLSALVSSFNFLATFISIPLVDRVGRRALTLVSLAGTLVGLLVLGTGFKLASTNSPPSSLLLPNTSSHCHSHRSCAPCVSDPACNFCFQPDDSSFLNSFCSPSSLNITTINHNNDDLSSQCSDTFNTSFLLDNHPIGSSINNYKHLDMTWKASSRYCSTSFSWLSTFGMALFLIFFAPGMGPMPWTINSEIYPNWARSTCVSIATCVNWLSNMVVSFVFLSLIQLLGGYGVFFLFAALVFFFLLLLFLLLPETKGRSLEEIEEVFKGHLLVANNTPKLLKEEVVL